ncbi:MAG: D-Ala-D-Ala carboxypeptidase family metallohydrolase [Gemmatimonadaceae bacterium]
MGRSRSRLAPALFFGVLAAGSLTVLSRADAALGPSLGAVERAKLLPHARTASSAHGRSRAVRMLTALPSSRLDLPLELSASPAGVDYDWVPVGALAPVSARRPLDGPIFAPSQPGFYRLAIVHGGERRILDSLTLGVLMPLTEKRGASINGYRIGFYRGERRGDLEHAPAGFLEIDEADAELPVSQHLRIDDFLTHDNQTTWPRYLAMNPRLLDKLELVFEEIVRWRGSSAGSQVDVDVHSGFRTPLHNRRVPRAAGDSRHQYGDAADIAVDANGDGHVTWVDVAMVARAVDVVERTHPDLVGGLGLYRGGSPYAHIDVRGSRARWRG